MADTFTSPAPFAHWMLREIYEQPAALAATLAAVADPHGFLPEPCDPLRRWLRDAGAEIVIAASGSSRHAGLAAELFIENRSGIAVDVEYASEYSYREGDSLKAAPVLVISQSGETVDTLAALRKAKETGHPTMAITNVAASSMAREADIAFLTQAGRERAVPATKSFTTQLLNLYVLSLLSGEVRGRLDDESLKPLLQQLHGLPALIESQLAAWDEKAQVASKTLGAAKSFLFLGRDVHYPIAREGALKLKESSYLHAEGYPSGELKHGPNALVSDKTPLVMLATHDKDSESSVLRHSKMLQLMADMKQQGATILAIGKEGDREVEQLATYTIPVKETQDDLLTICEVIPLQMLAYHIAIEHGIDVDHPRNLSKAVLAE